jgi:hypothetical protein
MHVDCYYFEGCLSWCTRCSLPPPFLFLNSFKITQWSLSKDVLSPCRAVLQEVTGNIKGDLPGQYSLPGNNSLVVYGPRQWFTPCAWNDWGCSVSAAFLLHYCCTTAALDCGNIVCVGTLAMCLTQQTVEANMYVANGSAKCQSTSHDSAAHSEPNCAHECVCVCVFLALGD